MLFFPKRRTKGLIRMNFINPEQSAAKEAAKLIEEIENLPSRKFSSFDKHSTLAVFVDIINGFIKEGAMASSRIADIIEPSAELLKKCNEAGIICAAFADCHSKSAAEFMSFPPHCIVNTSESEIVDELKNAGTYTLIPKNSTNGFHEEKFRALIECHPAIDTFIVAGDCTDICVLQFCLSLKTYFTAQDKPATIVIPVNCTETYDAPYHSSDFANLAAYKLMKDSGITFVKCIE